MTSGKREITQGALEKAGETERKQLQGQRQKGVKNAPETGQMRKQGLVERGDACSLLSSSLDFNCHMLYLFTYLSIEEQKTAVKFKHFSTNMTSIPWKNYFHEPNRHPKWPARQAREEQVEGQEERTKTKDFPSGTFTVTATSGSEMSNSIWPSAIT